MSRLVPTPLMRGALVAVALLAQPHLSPVGPTALAGQEAGAPGWVLDPLDWRMVGPYRGGRSTAVAGVPGLPHTYFQGTTGGGVWKTEDAGTTWVNLTDGQLPVAAVGAVAVAEADPNVIYVGTGSACVRGNISAGRGLYRSLDGGDTWGFIGLEDAGQIGDIQVHPRDENLVYVAALGHAFGKNETRGVFRSRDGGGTWENVLFLNDSTGAVDLALNPRNPREMYAGMWRAERKPWTMISGGAEGGVYKSTDGGDSWTKLAGGLPEGVVGKVGVTVSPVNPDRVWAIIEAEPEGGVYRSDDAGKTWRRLNSENRLRQRAWYYTHIEADPNDEFTVWVLNTGLYRSVDGGSTYQEFAVPHGDVHDLWISPDDSDHMVVANDGGAQVSLTGAETWSTYYNQPTAELYDVLVDNGFPYRLWGSQQDNDGISVPVFPSPHDLHPKSSWEYASSCETGPVAFHPDFTEVIWGGCYGGAINRFDRTSDQRRNVIVYPQLQLGQAAKDLEERFQWVAPIVVSPHDPDVVYHASQRVHRTTDGGMTWETISPDLTTDNPAHQEAAGGPINNDVTGVEIYNTIFSLAASPHTLDVLWAGSDDGRIHVTRNGGGDWQDVTPPGMPELGTVDEIDVSLHNPGKVTVAVQRYRLDDFAPYVFQTVDYGRTWRLLTDGRNGIPADHPVRTVREDPEREGLLVAGTEFGIFVSFDDGRRWQSLQQDLPATPVSGMRITHGDIQISTQGRSFWILDDMTPLRQYSAALADAQAHLFRPKDVVRASMAGGGVGGEHAPEPHPGGAILNYAVNSEVEGEVRVEVVDGQGRVATFLTTDSAVSAERGRPRLDASRGGHRVVWDMTYDGPRLAEGAVVWGYTGGVKAPPGEYTARLTVNGNTYQQPFRVLADPRLDVAQADYEEQFRVAMAVRDSLQAVHDAIATIRAVAEQVEAAKARAAAAGMGDRVAPLADSIGANLEGVETRLLQTRSESGQDPIRFPGQLDNQLAELYGFVTGTDGYISGGPEGRPTAGAMERLRDLNLQWEGLRTRLQFILENDVDRFNELMRDLGLPAVRVEGGRIVT
ncbi:MAG TPA: hypothetical protein VLA43_09370 [Longimicrobiales bacterium]|nr:hypothetical protein [Longimicrobiales bacterium]